MEPSLRVSAYDRILSWSDSHVGGLEFHPHQHQHPPPHHHHHHSMAAAPHSPPWLDSLHSTTHSGLHSDATLASGCSLPSTSSSMTARHPLNGQLSPISTSVDVPPGPSTDDSVCSSMVAPPMSHSASSSITDSWSLVYGGETEEVSVTHVVGDHDDHWEHGSDEGMAVPKVEPIEEDVRLDEIREATLPPLAPNATSPTATTLAKPKRPRGRPRKHPLTPAVPANKVTKGRSKTGCLTCRKRKKKCDEAKPRCTCVLLATRPRQGFQVLIHVFLLVGMNCEKNAVVCEGYPEKQIWKSGKEKAAEGMFCCFLRLVCVCLAALVDSQFL